MIVQCDCGLGRPDPSSQAVFSCARKAKHGGGMNTQSQSLERDASTNEMMHMESDGLLRRVSKMRGIRISVWELGGLFVEST